MQINKNKFPILVWLCLLCFMIIGMVSSGGLTRLTGSGLSIVVWEPIMGVVPPLSDEDWNQAFKAYQEFPEYQSRNFHMTVADFKIIFLWEYTHRLFARLVGIVFLLPFVFFYWRRPGDRQFLNRAFPAFIVGGLQGAWGWYMVQSGLLDVPSVSHFRLAGHLFLAFLLLGYLFWLLLDWLFAGEEAPYSAASALKKFSHVITGALCLQIIVGAFTAGLHAGIGFNTFPKMGPDWVPSSVLMLEPLYRNFLENPVTLQFVHRSLGWTLFVFIFLFWYAAKSYAATKKQMLSSRILFFMVSLQFLLGVMTLVYVVPVPLAAAHQIGACFLFLAAIFANHSYRRI